MLRVSTPFADDAQKEAFLPCFAQGRVPSFQGFASE